MIGKLKQLIAEYEVIDENFEEILSSEKNYKGCVTEAEIEARTFELRVTWDDVRRKANVKMAEIMALRQEIEKEYERCVQFSRDYDSLMKGLSDKFFTPGEKQKIVEYKMFYTSRGFKVPEDFYTAKG